MVEQKILKEQAELLSKEERKKIIMSFSESELHKYLKELFIRMEPKYTVEITHGANELGKDLVIVKRDEFGIDVTGVIVKCGDIQAKTLGDVDKVRDATIKALTYKSSKKIDEIESQVVQAFSHPAEMKTIFSQLPINKVLIVLAGELSNPARKRLEEEIKGNIEIFDIEKLINKFTNHYPQIYFEGGIIDFILDKIENLEKRYSSIKINKYLSEYFIEPPIATINIPDKLDVHSLALFINRRKIPFLDLKSIFDQNKKIILVGDPGVGKSAALAKLTIDMLREASNQVTRRKDTKELIKIPVLIQSKDILNIDNANELLNKYFSKPYLKSRFTAKALVVDGLDEIQPDNRREVIGKAEKFAQELSCSLVITSRKISIVETPPSGFERYELLPFEFGQAIKLFKKVINNKQILDTLKDGLEKIRFFIPMVPLSLILLIQLVEEQKEIPASVTELYDRFFDIALGRYDHENKGISLLFEYIIKKKFLAALAYNEFFIKEKLDISKKEFNEFLMGYASRYGWTEKDFEGFVKEIERGGIIDIKDKVIFCHRSFLDYFIAFYIYDKRDEFDNLNDYIVKIYFNDFWQQVAFFYIGLKREVNNSILDKIFRTEKKDLITYINKFIVGKLLQAGWDSSTDIKYHGIEKAIAYAPIIRDELLKTIGKSKGIIPIPRIFADFLVMSLSDFAFSSTFLLKETQSLYNKLVQQNSKDSFNMLMPLLWSMKRFLNQNELREIINNFLVVLSNIPKLTPEEQSRTLLFLMAVEQNDITINKSIKKKLSKLRKKYPEIFKKLLPSKKGFR